MASPKKRAKPPKDSKKAPEPRKRRSAEEARGEILDAAERRLVEAGPAGIRLQDVAADVGVAHPTVLHHFGSREALVREVCERRFGHIHEDVVKALGASAGSAEHVSELLDSVYQALHAGGHGRVVFWLALEGLLVQRGEGEQLRFHDVALAAHALRQTKRKGRSPPLEDTQHAVALAALVLLAESVIGKSILRDAGLGGDASAGKRFREWLGRLLADHMEHGPR